MDTLLTYLNSLSAEERKAFCDRCGTSEGYLRKAVSIGQKLGESICINIDRESGGDVKVEMLRPDVDWAHIRNSKEAA
jgi:DNA-binding transcriptional regulator YdaS (Cro superfamily)